MRSDDLYLVDLIESAQSLELLLRDRDFRSFASDDALCSAVLWKLYVVSEASTKLSAQSRDRLKSVPWDEIRGFRNRLAHGYFTLQWDRVWQIAKHSAPLLRYQAEEILAREFPDIFRQLVERRSKAPDQTDH